MDGINVVPYRITLRAYARDHCVELLSNGRVARAGLIDICRGGARLLTEFPAETLASVGDGLGLNILVDHGHLQSGPVPCTVTWVSGREIEVGFLRVLDMGVSELQTLVDHAPAA